MTNAALRSPEPRPFLPNDREKHAGRHIVRAAAASFLARARPDEFNSAEHAAKQLWPADPVPELILRTATSPATLTGAGWASQIAASSVASFIGGLVPLSAAARLLTLGMKIEFAGKASIAVPAMTAAAANASWVVEGAPVRIRPLNVGSVTLTPRKLATISVFSLELAKASTPTIEEVIKTVLQESAVLALGAGLFSATAASTSQPAGLLAGLTPLTASAAVDSGDRSLADVTAVAAAVSSVAGNVENIVLIASPQRALKLKLLMAGGRFALEVLASSAVPDGTLIAVAVNTLVSGFGTEPRFDTNDTATLHFEDTTPLELATAGAPNTVAAPVRSLWQSGLVGVKMTLPTAWGVRAPGGVAHISAASW